MRTKRKKTLEKHEENQLTIKQQQIKRRLKVAEEVENIQFSEHFRNVCDFYGVKPFIKEQGSNSWEENFLNNVKNRMLGGQTLTETQISTLWNILDGDGRKAMATHKQKQFLVRLGYEGDIDELTKKQASEEIKRLKGNWR